MTRWSLYLFHLCQLVPKSESTRPWKILSTVLRKMNFSRENQTKAGYKRVSPPDPRSEGQDSRLFFHFEGRESTLDPPNEEKGRRVESLGREFASSDAAAAEKRNSFCSRQGSGDGAWQWPAQSDSSSVGLGSWSEFSRPSPPKWSHERRAVTNVSQDPSPEPRCVSFFHSRPLPCSEFLKSVNSRPKKIEFLPRLPTQGPWVGRYNAQCLFCSSLFPSWTERELITVSFNFNSR